MFNNPAITVTLTVILLLSASFHFVQAARPRHATERVNEVLHALMNVLMAAMLWNLAPSTMLAQISVLAAAALWFVLQAVARPEFKMLCAAGGGKLKCAYHGATMAAAAVMIAMMGHTTAGQPGAAVTAAPAHSHHAMTSSPQPPPTTPGAMGTAPATLLMLFFAAAALVFVILMARQRTARQLAGRGSARRTGRGGLAYEALGASLMALMFGVMAV